MVDTHVRVAHGAGEGRRWMPPSHHVVWTTALSLPRKLGSLPKYPVLLSPPQYFLTAYWVWGIWFQALRGLKRLKTTPLPPIPHAFASTNHMAEPNPCKKYTNL